MAPRQIKMSVKDKQVPRKDSSEEAPSQRKQTEAGSAIFDSEAVTAMCSWCVIMLIGKFASAPSERAATLLLPDFSADR